MNLKNMKLMFLGGIVGAGLVIAVVMGLSWGGTEVKADEAQNTWHVLYMGEWPAEQQVLDGKPMRGTDFVEQLPAECDLLISPHDDAVFYYSCPEPFTPENPFGS